MSAVRFGLDSLRTEPLCGLSDMRSVVSEDEYERELQNRRNSTRLEPAATLDIHKAEYWCATATRGLP